MRPPLEQLREILTEGVFHRAVVLGTPRKPPPGAQPRGHHARASLGERQLCEVDALAATGHAPAVLAHLARVLAPAGQCVRAGDVVILGSMNPPASPEPGQRMDVGLSGIGHVALDFVD